MTSPREHQIRAFAGAVKQSILATYSSGPEKNGYDMVEITAWEILDCAADVHGDEQISEMCYRFADRFATGRGIAVRSLEEPAPAPVPEIAPPAPAQGKIKRPAGLTASVVYAFTTGLILGQALTLHWTVQ